MITFTNTGGGGVHVVLGRSISVHHHNQIVATLPLEPDQRLSVSEVKAKIQSHKLPFQTMSMFYDNKLLEHHDDLYFQYSYTESSSIDIQLRGMLVLYYVY